MNAGLISRTMVVAVLCIVNIGVSGEPKSDKAKEAFGKNSSSVKKANEVYWQSVLNADKALLADLEVAEKIAQRKKDNVELEGLRSTLEQLKLRISEQLELLKQCAPATTPRPFSYEPTATGKRIELGMSRDDFLTTIKDQKLKFRVESDIEELVGGKVVKREHWSSDFKYVGTPQDVYLENGIIKRLEQ